MAAMDRVLQSDGLDWILRRILGELPERSRSRVALVCWWWGDTVHDMNCKDRPILLSSLLRQLEPPVLPSPPQGKRVVRDGTSLATIALHLIWL